MFSFQTFSAKYHIKFVVILLIIFLLLKFMVELKLYEALLLSLIISITIIIIENIISINNDVLDPISCDQCKIEKTVELEGEGKSALEPEMKEPFIEDITTNFKNLYTNLMNKVVSNNKSFNDPVNDEYEYKCVRIKKKTIDDIVDETTVQDEFMQSTDMYNNGSNKLEKFETVEKKNNVKNTITPVTSSVNAVQYQQDGLQELASIQSEKVNDFRRSIGNQELVDAWTKDGNKFYSDMSTRSTGVPPASVLMDNELKYGDYNYVGPLNKGMVNKDYTFVSPTNWYPIPPHPPVCVTNKACTTCPVSISDGKDYMQWANWEDFDESRRFSGDMGINIEYVKNVLNNPQG